jgi:hypothetical protein
MYKLKEFGRNKTKTAVKSKGNQEQHQHINIAELRSSGLLCSE